MAPSTLFTRFLKALNVPHTVAFSDASFRRMTFQSLYGLYNLLREYGVKSQAVKVTEKDRIADLPLPFLAQTQSGIFVIVKAINSVSGMVSYDSRGENLSVNLDDFCSAWNGIALLAFPDKNSKEPEYASHHLAEMIEAGSKYVLGAAAMAIFIYFFVTRGLYSHLSTILLAFFNCAGLYFSYLLVQKSLNIHTAASDHVCSVLEKGGCDSILELKVSKLFGVFAWSEIGFAYFSISLITLLIFPHMWPALALCNLCCLPYTVWSIWYQKFKAHHWCTLCVGVQSTLWLLFFCYLGGGWLKASLHIHWNFIILGAAYLATVLALNIVFRIFKNLPCHEQSV